MRTLLLFLLSVVTSSAATLSGGDAPMQVQKYLVDQGVLVDMLDQSAFDHYALSGDGSLTINVTRWDSAELGVQAADDAWPTVADAQAAFDFDNDTGDTSQAAFLRLQTLLSNRWAVVVSEPADLSGQWNNVVDSMGATNTLLEGVLDASTDNDSTKAAQKNINEESSTQREAIGAFTVYLGRKAAGK